MKIRKFVGLAGVSKNENRLARSWGKRFEFAMILVAIWIPFQWYLEFKRHLPIDFIHISNWLVWLVLLSEPTTLLFLVTRKKYYLRRNWLNWVIIVAAFPFISGHTSLFASLRVLQLVIMLRALLPGWYSLVDILSRNRLGTTLMVAVIITVLWGVLLSAVDPAIKTPWDGIWWAWQTVTTVGYGDTIPTSTLGRILGILLMIMGVGLISLLTANFSAYFIGRGTKTEIKKEENELLIVLGDIQTQLFDIQTRLNAMGEKTKTKTKTKRID